MHTSASFHCEMESAWEGASRHQSVDGLCHFCCDSPHPSRAVSAGAACGAGSISQWEVVLVSIAKWNRLVKGLHGISLSMDYAISAVIRLIRAELYPLERPVELVPFRNAY